jgi:hypothetical protein
MDASKLCNVLDRQVAITPLALQLDGTERFFELIFCHTLSLAE